MRLPTDEHALHPTSKTGDNTPRQDLRLGWAQTVAEVQRLGREADYGDALDAFITELEAIPGELTNKQITERQQRLHDWHKEFAQIRNKERP